MIDIKIIEYKPGHFRADTLKDREYLSYIRGNKSSYFTIKEYDSVLEKASKIGCCLATLIKKA